MKIVILGGGFGGLNTALWLGEKLQDSDHEVILVADRPNFLFRPSLIWVPFGQRKIEDISFPLSTTLQKAGVQFLLNKVKQIFPKENKVEFQDQTTLNYDFLVLATSGFPDYESIDGLKGNTLSIYHAEDALKTKERVESLKSGEPIVVGVAQGNPCPSNAYEFLFELDDYLKQNKIKSPITFFTYEEELFDLSAKEASERLDNHMKEKDIPFHLNVNLEKVDKDQVYLSNGKSIPYSFSLILPRFKGADYIFPSNDIDHENGLVTVNHYLQTIQWDNIYAVGDTILIKDMPMLKNGRAAELQGHIAAKNIYSQLQGEPPQKEFQDSLFGLMELGSDGGMFMVKYPTSKLASSFLEWASDGTIPHLMKIAHEKYYMWKLS
jgi:sulfide:quinone oxidoreductase